MTFVTSAGRLRSLDRLAVPGWGGQWGYAVQLSASRIAEYGQIYRRQPSVRTVISFLSRNIAQLALNTYQRVADADRRLLPDHPLARLLERPNPWTTRYRLICTLVCDLAIYDAAYWLIEGRRDTRMLVRLDPRRMEPLGDNAFVVPRWRYNTGIGYREIPAEQVVHFHGYGPDDIRVGSSPIECLRRVLAEEFAAEQFREQVLRNGARMSGYLKRPPGPRWSDDAKTRFKAEWQAQYAGEGPAAGGTPVLEEGMEFVPAAQTAEQLQYIEVRKLAREEVASAYHIPPPMIGILDHATYSNIEQQHRQTYQDTLAPWLIEICQEIGLQLLPLVDPAGAEDGCVYTEFRLEDKLKGSFEEQARELQSAVGAPWLTRNEARARMNLPHLPDGDELVTPLNVLIGGQASPTDTAPDTAGGQADKQAGEQAGARLRLIGEGTS